MLPLDSGLPHVVTLARRRVVTLLRPEGEIMGFSRGHWRCAVRGCPEDAELSCFVMIKTPGGRTARFQKATSAIRLCRSDAKALAAGKMPDQLTAALGKVVRLALGERE